MSPMSPTDPVDRRSGPRSRPGGNERRIARSLGRRLARQIGDPEAFLTTLEGGLPRLGETGASGPVLRTIEVALRGPLDESSPAIAIYLAARLSQSSSAAARRLALVALDRALPDDPERSWQLLRRIGRTADDRRTVQALAATVARGIALEPYRWAELEQLVYSPRPLERRLVGVALARVARGPSTPDRSAALRAAPGIGLVASLLGDPDPDVVDGLGRALRAWLRVDPEAVGALLRREGERAVTTGDPARARVVATVLGAATGEQLLPNELRSRLERLRRRRAGANTSEAFRLAAAFRAASPGLPGPEALAEPPLGPAGVVRPGLRHHGSAA